MGQKPDKIGQEHQINVHQSQNNTPFVKYDRYEGQTMDLQWIFKNEEHGDRSHAITLLVRQSSFDLVMKCFAPACWCHFEYKIVPYYSSYWGQGNIRVGQKPETSGEVQFLLWGVVLRVSTNPENLEKSGNSK